MDKKITSWLATAEPGWKPVKLPHTLGAQTFLSGDPGRRMRIQYFSNKPASLLMAKMWFGPLTQGPPGHVHGGTIAAVLDEAMGGAAWMEGHPVVAAEITTRFKRMLPLESLCLAEAKVTSTNGRKVRAESTLSSPEGLLYAEGTGLFIELELERLLALAEETGDLAGYLRKRA